MSAATSPALEATETRALPRQPIHVPLDLIILRSGVPESLPGRCTDLCESGVGAVIAGEVSAGQQVAVEFRLPDVGVPVRARALVRHQSSLHYGLEFIGLSMEQREMVRYWLYRSASDVPQPKFENVVTGERAEIEGDAAARTVALESSEGRRVRIGRGGWIALLSCVVVLAGLGWWQWQNSWSELEAHAGVSSGLRVSPETMQSRLLTKIDPVYPEAARASGTQGLVVLDAVIAPDGSVKRLRPVSGPDLLVHSATAAVQSWKFEPYLSSGRPVEVETTIAVEFRLN